MSETAQASLSTNGDQLLIGGDWSVSPLPTLDPLFETLLETQGPLNIDVGAVKQWDPRLEAKLLHLQRRAFAEQRDIEYLGAPDTQTQLMKLATAVAPYAGTAT
ncbi:MAG: phospholipid/cholesterol/gamma-HCH transport system permease protein, partial [Congregibacter sp.]